MNKEQILLHLDFKSFYQSLVINLKENGKDQAMGLCPFHDDHHPSLSINLRSGLWNCLAGCGGGDVFSFYQRLKGVDFKTALSEIAERAGLTPEPQRRLIKTYNYVNESGDLLFQVCRYEPRDFKQRRPDGKGGWIYSIKGITPVLYNLPQVIRADTVFICEGEKDCDNLMALGLVATTNPWGAGKWRDEYNQYFEGKEVIILPDNDLPGKDHALRVAKSLYGIAKSVKVVGLAGLGEKEDVSDWLSKGGGTKEGILGQVEATPEFDLSALSDIGGGQADSSISEPFSYLKKGSDLQVLECSIEWIVDRLIPKQSIILLHGRGGIGKTWLSLNLGDSVSKGTPFMGLATQKLPVVFVDFENSLPVLVERVRKIGIEDVLFWHNSEEVLKPPRLDRKDWELYKALPPGSLLIFDTLRASQGKDENDSRDMAFIISRLKELRDMGFTILLLHHTPKSNDKIYKGSTAILDLTDHVLSLHKVKKTNIESEIDEDEDDTNFFYRLGTKDKTRYEPFHIFIAFDPNKGFIKAEDPDEEVLQVIHEILQEKGTLNQSQVFDVVKEELDIKRKEKLISLLRKGEGKYWASHKEKRAVYYEPLGPVLLSTPYKAKSGQVIKDPTLSVQTYPPNNTPHTLDTSQLSACPDTPRTDGTDEDFDLREGVL